jgi:hypothetical protein
MMRKYHTIQSLQFSSTELIIKIDNISYTFVLQKISKKLYNAGQNERENFTISPSGYGISWPIIDEDLSIDGLLGVKNKPELKKKISIPRKNRGKRTNPQIRN